MSAIGALTRSGLLYEGNFADWHARVDALLEVHGLTLSHSRHGKKSPTGLIIQNRSHLKPRAIVDLVTSQVSPALMARVPMSRATDGTAADVLRHIKRFAAAFRLLDLPPEIRNSIYTYYLCSIPASECVLDLDANKTRGIPKAELCSVSRQIRHETMNLAILHMTLQIRCSARRGEPLDGQVVHRNLQLWEQTLSKPEKQLLRRVDVQVKGSRALPGVLTLSWTQHNGTELWSNRWASQVEEIARETAASLTVATEGHDSQGRSLLLTILDDPELWASFERPKY